MKYKSDTIIINVLRKSTCVTTDYKTIKPLALTKNMTSFRSCRFP